MAEMELFPEPANSATHANCARCGVRCRKAAGNPEARLLAYSLSDHGFCLNCAVTEFLQNLDVIRDSMILLKKPFDPAAFRLTHVQQQFFQIMAAGNADAKPTDIDWLEVEANWHLPFPAKPKKRRKKRK